MEGERNKKQTSKGRRKVELKRVLEKKEDRMRAFSKQKTEIHRKAVEISTLCGVNVAFFAVSPSGKPTTFTTTSGHPAAAPAAALEELILKLAEAEMIRDGDDSDTPEEWCLEGLSLEELDMEKKKAMDLHKIIKEHIRERSNGTASPPKHN